MGLSRLDLTLAEAEAKFDELVAGYKKTMNEKLVEATAI